MAVAVPLETLALPAFEVAAFDNTPVVRLRDYLIDAKRGYEPFDLAWHCGVRLAVHGLARSDQDQWRRIFTDTQHEWRSCYNGTVSKVPRLAALQNLAMGAAA